MMAKVKDTIWSVGENTRDYASRVGCATSDLAHRVGWKRGGIALGAIAVAVAVPFIVRFLRSRRAETEGEELPSGGRASRLRRREAASMDLHA